MQGKNEQIQRSEISMKAKLKYKEKLLQNLKAKMIVKCKKFENFIELTHTHVYIYQGGR